MGFDAKDYTIQEIIVGKQVYRIPRNQRRYVWDQDNWQELFDDVVYAVESGEPHFMGSIVLKTENDKNGLSYFSIIDGQQRLITMTILLSTVMYFMKKLGMEKDFNVTKEYLVTKDDNDDEVVVVSSDSNESLAIIIKRIIELSDEDIISITFNKIIDGEIINRSDKCIANAYKFFYKKLEDLDVSEHGEILVNIRNAIRNIRIIKITASSEEDSYTIFEILNARGMDLDDHELLKNYIMRFIKPEGDRDVAKNDWMLIEQKIGERNMKDFVRHYRIHKYGDNHGKGRMSDYKTIKDGNKKKHNTIELLHDIQKKSEYYDMLLKPDKDTDNRKCAVEEFQVYDFFKKENQKQLRPIFLSLISKEKSGKLSTEKYIKVLDFLYVFYVSFKIIGQESSNQLTDIINKYAYLIENSYSDDVVNDFIEALKKKIPQRERFINAFKTIGWSHNGTDFEGTENKKRTKTVIRVLEKYKTGMWRDDFTLEHVLPDSQDVENGQIGNLIPLEEDYNEKCKDKDLKDKIKYYKKSSFATAREFIKHNSVDNFNPSSRTEFMAEQFYDDILKL